MRQLPISTGIAGVSMRLKPGGLRELHWHANAAEWAYVIKGKVRTTAIAPDGTSETNDFEPGDVWYFPRGHGHMLECLGDEPCHFVLIFDNGYAPAFGTFSSTDWVGHTPKALLAKQFGLGTGEIEPCQPVGAVEDDHLPVMDRLHIGAGVGREERESLPCAVWHRPP